MPTPCVGTCTCGNCPVVLPAGDLVVHFTWYDHALSLDCGTDREWEWEITPPATTCAECVMPQVQRVRLHDLGPVAAETFDTVNLGSAELPILWGQEVPVGTRVWVSDPVTFPASSPWGKFSPTGGVPLPVPGEGTQCPPTPVHDDQMMNLYDPKTQILPAMADPPFPGYGSPPDPYYHVHAPVAITAWRFVFFCDSVPVLLGFAYADGPLDLTHRDAGGNPVDTLVWDSPLPTATAGTTHIRLPFNVDGTPLVMVRACHGASWPVGRSHSWPFPGPYHGLPDLAVTQGWPAASGPVMPAFYWSNVWTPISACYETSGEFGASAAWITVGSISAPASCLLEAESTRAPSDQDRMYGTEWTFADGSPFVPWFHEVAVDVCGPENTVCVNAPKCCGSLVRDTGFTFFSSTDGSCTGTPLASGTAPDCVGSRPGPTIDRGRRRSSIRHSPGVRLSRAAAARP